MNNLKKMLTQRDEGDSTSIPINPRQSFFDKFLGNKDNKNIIDTKNEKEADFAPRQFSIPNEDDVIDLH